ncbi:MAG: translocation/assembly module TamB domain-containing protein [Spirochaetia bacterium]
MSSDSIQLKWRFLEILILLVIITLGTLFVQQIGTRLDRRMEELKTEVLHMLEARIGRRISYERMSPSVFGYLGIRGLIVYSQNDPEEVLLRINRVKVYYNLFRFLSTRAAILALSEIQIANSEFNIDYDRDRELLDLLDSLRTGSGITSNRNFFRQSDGDRREEEFPQIDISGSNITLRYTYGDWQLSVTDLFFTAENQGDLYEIGVRGSIEVQHTRKGSPVPAWLSTRVKINGSLDRFFTWSDLAIRIYSLSTETIDLKRQTLQVTYDSSSLNVRKIQDRAPLDLQVLYDTASKDLSFQFTAERFQPASLFQLTGPLKRFSPYLLSYVSSSGSVDVNLDELRLRYSADLQIELPGEVLPFDVSVFSRITGNEEIMYLDPLVFDTSRGRVEFLGNVLVKNLMPSGLLRINDLEPVEGQNLNATLNIERGVQALSIEGKALSLGETLFDSFTLNLAPEGRSVGFTVAAVLEGAPESGSLEATGGLSWEAEPTLQVEASLNRIPLNTIYRLLVPEQRISPRLEQRLRQYTVSAAAGATTDFFDFTLSAEQVEVLEEDQPDNTLRFAGNMTGDTAEITDIRAEWQGYSLRGDITAERLEESTELSSLFWFEDVPYQIDLDVLPGNSVRVSGSYGLEGYYSFTRTINPVLLSGRVVQLWGNPFRLSSESLPVTLRQGTMYVSLDMAGLMDANGSPYATSSMIRVRNIPFSTVKKNSLEMAFELYDDRLFLNRIAYQDGISELIGSGIADLEDLVPIKANASIRLQSPQGAELYSSDVRIDGTQIQGQLEFARSPIERFGIEAVNGDVSGSIAIDGTRPRPDLKVVLSLNDGRLNLDPLGLELSATYTEESVELSSLNVSFLRHRIEGVRGNLDIESGAFEFQSRYRAEYFEQIVNLQVDLRGSIGGLPWPLTLDRVLENDINGLLTLSDITVDDRSVPQWLVSLQGEGGVLSFDGGPSESIHGTIGRDGSFTLNLLEPLPIQGRARGTVLRNQLESDFTITALDMRIINTMTPATDIFTFTTGSAQGALRIVGPINDPDWIGYLDVSNAELEFSLSPDTVKPLNARLIFDGKNFTLPRTTSFSGDTKIEGEGFFYIDHWRPEGVELIFYVEEYPGVHVSYPFDTVFVDGYATGAVRVRSDSTTTRLDGKIRANSCRIALQRKERDQPVSEVRPALPLSVDIDISTGRSVEFYWPAINFPIVRTYARQGEQVAIYINEETGEFFMEGEVEIRGGEVFYFDRSFYLKQGSIAFKETLDEFDPWIYALAEIRERDFNNEEIKIFLEVNNKLSLFSPRFYSEPSRPDVEILNLIGGTILNRFGQTDFGTAAVMLTSDIIGQFGILTPFERAVREVLNLDLFTVRTQFLQNVLIGKIRGENLVENSFNPLDNTTLTLGKYLGTDLFLEALVRFQNVDDLTSSSNIRTEGELNLEWVTPFFLLEWTFTPTHPENLFLSDNSIGLSWKYSY